MRISNCVPALAGFLVILALPAGAAVMEDMFQLRNTGDLVELCSAPQSDPLFTAAQNFCHGFTVGVFRVLQEEDMALQSRHLFCVPSPMPSRNEAIASFVQWARANPNQMGQPASDGVATFLSQQYPCAGGR
jgi:Rap1a immunity proteins